MNANLRSQNHRVFRVQRFWTFFSLIVLSALILTACGGTPASIEATPAPYQPPKPEGFDGYNYSAAEAARRSCDSMPVWVQHTDWRGLDLEITQTGQTEIFVGDLQVAYVVIGKVYVNDRVVEFRPGVTEVYQLFEDKAAFELNPEAYIERAFEILDGDVAPVAILALWRWAKDESGEYNYDYWRWEVTSVACSRLEAVVPPRPTREPHRPN